METGIPISISLINGYGSSHGVRGALLVGTLKVAPAARTVRSQDLREDRWEGSVPEQILSPLTSSKNPC